MALFLHQVFHARFSFQASQLQALSVGGSKAKNVSSKQLSNTTTIYLPKINEILYSYSEANWQIIARTAANCPRGFLAMCWCFAK